MFITGTLLSSPCQLGLRVWLNHLRLSCYILRGILLKICPFSRLSLPMWQTYTDMRICYLILPYL